MFPKKTKVKSVRNILESPFQIHWPEKTEDEIIPIQNALKELLPDAKLEQVVLNKQHKKSIKHKEPNNYVSRKRRQRNIFRQFLALGFQSVIRGLEKKELCCIVVADNTTTLLQKVILAHTQINNVPITIIPDLKMITKSALGFATMALGFKNAVADSTNKFFSIYSLVSQNPIVFDKEAPKLNEDVVMEETDKNIESPKPLIDTEELYLYRSQVEERAFIPELNTGKSNQVIVKKEEGTLESFACLKKQNLSSSIAQSICNNLKDMSSSDDTDSDVDNIFFVDKRQDESLLSKKCEPTKGGGRNIEQSKQIKLKRNVKKGISFKLSNTNEVNLEHKPNLSLGKAQNTKKKNSINGQTGENKHCFPNSPKDFYPLTIKTITHNSKKKRRKKK